MTKKLARRSVKGTACSAAALTLVGCGFFGPRLDYPPDLPLPPSASEVLSDTGFDDDEPLRSRQQVLDVPGGTEGQLLGFYQGAFPETEGWSTETNAEEQLVCLSRQSDDGYEELVEVFSYQGSRVDVRPERFLALNSRIHTGAHCGAALAWVPLDLIE